MHTPTGFRTFFSISIKSIVVTIKSIAVAIRNNVVTIKSIVVQLKKLNEVYPIVSESRSLFGTTHGPGFVTIMTIKRP